MDLARTDRERFAVKQERRAFPAEGMFWLRKRGTGQESPQKCDKQSNLNISVRTGSTQDGVQFREHLGPRTQFRFPERIQRTIGRVNELMQVR